MNPKNMDYPEYNLFKKYDKYTFYKGVCGGMQILTSVFASSIEDAKEVARINRIRDWDVIIKSTAIN